MSTPHVADVRMADVYQRNNEYMLRSGPAPRPTPPPAVGHGRPKLPRWQHDQENSEEAAMSALQGEMERVRLGEQNQEMEEEVMNSTPPNESALDRFLRED